MTKLGRGELIIALLLGSFPPMRKGLLWCHWISYYNVSIATDIFDLLTAICKRTRTKVALRNMLFLTQMELLSHGWQERRHLLVFGRFVPLHHNFHMGRSTLSAGFVCSKPPPQAKKTRHHHIADGEMTRVSAKLCIQTPNSAISQSSAYLSWQITLRTKKPDIWLMHFCACVVFWLVLCRPGKKKKNMLYWHFKRHARACR